MKLLPLFAALLAGSIMTTAKASSLYDIPVKDIGGQNTSLSPYRGKVLLIVNVASACGFTRQYTGLQTIYKKYAPQGLVVLGFPCNQFGHQESGTNEEIKTFCSAKFHVTFPLFDKIDVNGARQHPLYTALSGKDSPFPGKITWNFNKFLVGRDGKILQRFDSKVTPESPDLIAAVEAALAAK